MLFARSAAGKAFEKSEQGILFLCRKMQGTDVRVESRIRMSTAIVEVQDFMQALEAAVVHVGCCQLDVAQCRGLKISFILRPACHHEASPVAGWLFAAAPVPGHPGVVKFLIGELAAGMTDCAARLAASQAQACLLL